MVDAANFRSDFNSASRESASEAEFAAPGVAHGDRLAGIRHAICCARRSAPSPAAAPRSPHAIVRSIRSPDPRFVTTPKIDDVGSRREPVSPQHRTPRPDRPSAIVSRSPNVPQGSGGSRRKPLARRGAPAAGAGRSGHADARRTPRRRGGVVSAPDRMSNAANFRSHFNSASRVRGSPRPSRARRRQRRWLTRQISEAISTARAERALVRRNSPAGCCARRPPSWNSPCYLLRTSIGAVTRGRAAVASRHRPQHPQPRSGIRNNTKNRRRRQPAQAGQSSAPHPSPRSPERHRQPLTQCPTGKRRQPAQAARSPRRTGGWCGSVRSRRCAPHPSPPRRRQTV